MKSGLVLLLSTMALLQTQVSSSDECCNCKDSIPVPFGFEKVDENVYVKAFTTGKTWFDAQEVCQNIGGHLATFRSAPVLKKILDKSPTNHYLWVGLNRQSYRHPWMWSNGTQLGNGNQIDRMIQNNKTSYSPGCVYAHKRSRTASIRNYYCYSHRGYICQYNPNTQRPPAYQIPSNTWLSAVTICQTLAGSLPMMKTEAQWKRFKNNTRTFDFFWIGIEDMEGDGKLRFVDGNEHNSTYFQNWASGLNLNDELPGRCAYANLTGNTWHITTQCSTLKYPGYCDLSRWA